MDSALTIKDGDIGQLPFVTEYEYDDFTLSVRLNDTYNKPQDYRKLDYYGLVYSPSGMYKRMAGYTKDILGELVK